MDRQAIFNKVKAHLLAQNARALNSYGLCMYRTEDGKKCAIGCLIPDDKYAHEMEQRPFSNLNTQRVLEEVFGRQFENKDNKLLADLVHCHDSFQPNDWKQRLEDIASRHDLAP